MSEQNSEIGSVIMIHLTNALDIMDRRGRNWPDNSRGLWQNEWNELRMSIFSARQILNDSSRQPRRAR